MTQNPEQKQPVEVPSENKGLTPKEFNQLANLGLGKVYFLPVTETRKIDSTDQEDTLARIESVLGNNNRRLELKVAPDPALIILPVDENRNAYVIISRDGKRYVITKPNENNKHYQDNQELYNNFFNPDFPLNIYEHRMANILNAIATGQDPSSYLQHLANSLKCQFIDPSRSEEEFTAFEPLFNQALETAKSLKAERQARQERVSNTFDPKLRSLINE